MNASRTRARTATVAATASLLVVAAIAVVALARERRLLLEQARQDTTTLAALFEENTARTFDSVDTALEGVAIYVATVKPAKDDEAARETMRARLKFLPTVRALFVIGPDGVIIHDTDFPKTPRISLADRPYFRQYIDNPKLTHAVSEALQSRSGTGWFVASTRRITSRDGSFLGVAVAAVQLDTISTLYRKMDLRPGQQVSLFQSTGTLLARFPPEDALIGRNFGQYPVFSRLLPHQRSGTYETDGPPTNVDRIVSYRAVETQPLVVIVGTRLESALAPWKRTVAGSIAALAVLALLTGASLRFFLQRQERNEREEQLHEHARNLADVDRRRGEFLATLSHELRNVLTPIQNCSQILGMVDPSSQQAARAREIIAQQLVQMRRLVDDLLDVSRINTGKIQLDLIPTDLRGVLTQAAAAAQIWMERSHHQFELSLPEEELVVLADLTRIQQVFANLLGNAAKYTPDGGHIALRARREGGEAVIDVIDNGVGIPPEAQEKVFGMFEQVESHSDRRQGGLGIGLGLVSNLVALHGGRVELASAGAGLGSTFTVRMPLAGTNAAPDIQAANIR